MWRWKEAEQNRRGRVTWVAFCLLGATVLAPASRGNQAGPSPAPVGQIGLVKAIGDDLVVRVAWPQDANPDRAVEVRARDAEGGTLATAVSWTQPGTETDIVLDEALATIAARGFQVYITIDAPGVGIAAWRAVRMAYTCSENRVCAFEALSDIDAGPVAIDRRLAEALDRQADQGSSDVLGDALAADPTLLGDVLTLSGQLGPWGDAPTEDCLCFWEGAFRRSPSGTLIMHEHAADDEVLGWYGPAAAMGIGYQTKSYDGAFVWDFEWAQEGKASASLQIRCWRVEPGNSVQIDFVTAAGGTEPQVMSMPRLRDCDRDCGDAEVSLEGDVWGRVAVGAVGGALASAEIRASGVFDTPEGTTIQPLIDSAVSEVAIESPNSVLDLELAPCSVSPNLCSRTVMGRKGGVRLETDIWIEVTESAPARDFWSYASARVEAYRVVAHGEASCTVSGTGRVELTGGVPAESSAFCPGSESALTCGLVVDPWGG